MRSGVQVFILMPSMSLAGVCMGGNQEYLSNSFCCNFWARETLTNGFWGLDDRLTDSGVEIGLGATSIYQQNVKGGLSTHNHKGRYTGSYDLELSAGLRRLLGFETGTLLIHLEGGWPDEEGIDGLSAGSAFGVNADAIGNDAILVKQLYYVGPVFTENLTLMIGKIDFTGVFDASAYADDECTQFLNAAFVDDPTIPFPDYSLGAILNWDITDSWYLMGGMADAQADGRETGFGTTFHDEDYFLYIFEMGTTAQLADGSLQGAYRAGFWYDPQDKERFRDSKVRRDDVGFYLSLDQALCKEKKDTEDTQGLGVFVRYGGANSKVNEVASFWSVGFQYQGLFEGRDDDVLGLGFAHGTFSNKAVADFHEDYESVIELYYNAQICSYLSVSPSIQYITNPGGAKGVSDAVVFGVRIQMRF